MACWDLKYSSPFFDCLNLTSSDSERVSTLIDSAVAFVEKVCRRQFAQAEHDLVYTVGEDGSIVLRNAPISHLVRVSSPDGAYLTVSNPTGINPTWSTTGQAIKTVHYASGVRVDSSLSFATYPTLGALATAIDALGSGWNASVAAGYEQYPAADLVPQQFGSARSAQTVYSWADYTGSFDFNPDLGILSGFSRGQKVRVLYLGGFVDVPEDLKSVVANLVIAGFEGGKVTSENLGGYSYSLADLSSLPGNDKQILALYKDRGI